MNTKHALRWLFVAASLLLSIPNSSSAQEGPTDQALAISERFVTIMCQTAAGATDTQPAAMRDADYFSGMYPYLNSYLQEMSKREVILQGSAFGWFTLPEEKSHYTQDGLILDKITLAQDCIRASNLDLRGSSGIIFVLKGFSSGGTGNEFPGEGGQYCAGIQCWKAAWLPDWAWPNLGVVTHELLHSFGFPHTRGVGGSVYNDPYDVMSHAYSCGLQVPVYGCLPQGTGAYYRSIAGWVEPQNVAQLTAGTSTIQLSPVSIEPTSGIQLIVVNSTNGMYPIGYAIEVRELTGYDSGLPAAGVIIHRLNFGSGSHEPVLVTNLRGAMASVPGDTFIDLDSMIEISVLAHGSAGYTIHIRNGESEMNRYQVALPLVSR